MAMLKQGQAAQARPGMVPVPSPAVRQAPPMLGRTPAPAPVAVRQAPPLRGRTPVAPAAPMAAGRQTAGRQTGMAAAGLAPSLRPMQQGVAPAAKMPPGLAKKIAGVRSAKTFAPGRAAAAKRGPAMKAKRPAGKRPY